jgi:hypothetical protein
MRALVVTAVGTVALAFVALACAGGDGADRGRVEACTNEATMEAFTPVVLDDPSVAEYLRTSERPLFQPDDERHCRLRRALMTSADLPGWRFERGNLFDDNRVGGRAMMACSLELPGWHDGVFAGFTFPSAEEDQSTDTFLLHMVLAAPTGHGSLYMNAGAKNCAELSRSDDDDAGRTWKPLSVSEDVHDLIAWEEARSYDDPLSRTWWVTTRDDDVISTLLISGDLESVDLDRLTRLMATKLRDVGPLPERLPFAGEGCAPPATPQADNMQEALNAALLALDDLVGSWIEFLPAECGLMDIDWSDCAFLPALGGSERHPQASVEFRRGDRERIGQTVFRLADDATDAFAGSGFSRPVECEVAFQGEEFTLRILPLELDRVGDASSAYAIETSDLPPGFEIRMFVLVWARGAAGSAVLWIPSLPPFAVDDWHEEELLRDLLMGIVSRADAKFAAAAEEINRLNR